jgi:hypothetical protein
MMAWSSCYLPGDPSLFNQVSDCPERDRALPSFVHLSSASLKKEREGREAYTLLYLRQALLFEKEKKVKKKEPSPSSAGSSVKPSGFRCG